MSPKNYVGEKKEPRPSSKSPILIQNMKHPLSIRKIKMRTGSHVTSKTPKKRQMPCARKQLGTRLRSNHNHVHYETLSFTRPGLIKKNNTLTAYIAKLRIYNQKTHAGAWSANCSAHSCKTKYRQQIITAKRRYFRKTYLRKTTTKQKQKNTRFK